MRPGPDCALALALWAVAAPVRAGQGFTPGAGGALRLSADPPALVLGQDPGAELRIAAPDAVEELSVTASAGKVEGVRRLPGGGFAARYRPPPERHPQIAILAAVGRAGAEVVDGWLAVPLAGQGEAQVPGAPGEDVSLRIGDRSFGPRRVGGDGVALIPVVVPPGVREGHRGFAPVDLRVPDTSLLHAVADRRTVAADREEAVHVLAYVVAPHGAARGGDLPTVEVTRGALSLVPREPGAYQGTWTLPPGMAGEERATLRLPGSPPSHVVLRLTCLPGPAASVALELDPAALVAGQAEGVRITARAADAAGNPAPGPLALSADAGVLSEEETETGPGLARARLRVDPRLEGRGQVLVRARAASGAGAARPVPLVPGPAVRAALTPRARLVPGDAAGQAVLDLVAWDAFGNPAAGSPTVTASLGEAPVLEPGAPGRWVIRQGAAPAAAPARVRFLAELAQARAGAEVWLVPPPSSQLAFLAGGGGVTGMGDTLSGGQLLAGAELPLPAPRALPVDRVVGRALGLRLELLALGGAQRFEGGHRSLRAGAALAGPVLRGLSPGGRWFASATVGVLAGTAEWPGRTAEGGAGLAARLGLGVAVPLRRAAPFLELGFLAAAGPMGHVGALTLSAGARLDVVRRERGE